MRTQFSMRQRQSKHNNNYDASKLSFGNYHKISRQTYRSKIPHDDCKMNVIETEVYYWNLWFENYLIYFKDFPLARQNLGQNNAFAIVWHFGMPIHLMILKNFVRITPFSWVLIYYVNNIFGEREQISRKRLAFLYCLLKTLVGHKDTNVTIVLFCNGYFAGKIISATEQYS